MEITKEEVLAKLRQLVAKSLQKTPHIGVDSLALVLKMPTSDLLPMLYALEFEGHIQIHSMLVRKENTEVGLVMVLLACMSSITLLLYFTSLV